MTGGPKYLKGDFEYPASFGFSGSSVGRHDPKPHPDRGDAYGDRALLDKGDASAVGMAKGGPVRRAQGGPMKRVGDDVSKRGMMPEERQNYDVLRRNRIAGDRGEARSMATNPPDRLTPLTSDMQLPDDDGKRRGGTVKMAKGGHAKARYADGGAADAENYPPPALPGAPKIKPRAAVVPAADREAMAYKKGLADGARVGAKMATQHVLGSAMQAQQQRQPPRPMAPPAGAPPMQQSSVAPAQPGALSKGGKFIQKAHLKKGALHEDLGVPQGQKIPAANLEAATHSNSPTVRRRAVLAETMKGFHHSGKKG